MTDLSNKTLSYIHEFADAFEDGDIQDLAVRATMVFNGSQNLLNGYIDQFKTLSIGIKAYKTLVEQRRDQLQAAIANAMSEDPENIINEPGYGSFLMSHVDGNTTSMYYLTYAQMVRALSGDYPNVWVKNIGGVTSKRASTDIIKDLAHRTGVMSTSLGILAYAAYTNISNQIDWSAMTAKIEAYGGKLLEGDYPQIVNLPSSSTIIDLIQALFNVEKISMDEDEVTGELTLHSEDDYTTASTIEAGLDYTIQVTSDLALGLKNSITNMFDIVGSVVEMLSYIAVWLVQMLAQNLLVDYTILNDYDEVGVDIPIMTVQVSADAPIESWITEHNEWIQNGGAKEYSYNIGPFRGQSVKPNDYGFDDVLSVYSFFRGSKLKARTFGSWFKDNKQIYTFPTTHGFIEVIRLDNIIQFTYFAGAHSCHAWSPIAEWNYDESNEILTIDLADEAPSNLTPAQSVGEPIAGSNEEAAKYVRSCLYKTNTQNQSYYDNSICRILFDGLAYPQINIPIEAGWGNIGNGKDTASQLAEVLQPYWSYDMIYTSTYRMPDHLKRLVTNGIYCLLMFIPRNRHSLASLVVKANLYKETNIGVAESFDLPAVQPWPRDDSGQPTLPNELLNIGLPYYSGRPMTSSMHVQTTNERGKKMFSFVMACVIGIALIKNGPRIKEKIKSISNKITTNTLKMEALGRKIGNQMLGSKPLSDADLAEYKRLKRRKGIIQFITSKMPTFFSGFDTNSIVENLFPGNDGLSVARIGDKQLADLPDGNEITVNNDVLYTLITGNPVPSSTTEDIEM